MHITCIGSQFQSTRVGFSKTETRQKTQHTMTTTEKKIVTLRLSPQKLQTFQAAMSRPVVAASPASTPEPSKAPAKRKQPRKKLAGLSGAATPSSPFPDDAMPSRGSKSMLAAANAQLRSLDRSGAPCRRWVKEPVEIKSFTGFKYSLPVWCGLESTPSGESRPLPTTPASKPPASNRDQPQDAPTSEPPSELIKSET